jgi:hypothetical protein
LGWVHVAEAVSVGEGDRVLSLLWVVLLVSQLLVAGGLVGWWASVLVGWCR